MKKMRLVGMIITLFTGPILMAQSGLDNLIKGGSADANYLVSGYTAPFIKAFGSGLNQGWYNTADTHKWPGFDLTMSVALIAVPTSDKLFTVDNSKLTSLRLDGVPLTGTGQIPTFFGPTDPTNKTFSLRNAPFTNVGDAPTGVDIAPLKRVPVPIVNLGIGLPKGFDLKIRYLPNIDLGGSGKLGLFGVGVMHNIKQYIPGIKNLPFSLSAFVGYTKFNADVTIDQSKNQTSKFGVSSTTLQILASKKLAVLTVYGGVGYDISKGTLAVNGTYDLGNGQSITDPVNNSQSGNSIRGTAGLRLKLGPITFHGDYTIKKYSAITAGFGISIR